jgi:Rha family phage regulatory protein
MNNTINTKQQATIIKEINGEPTMSSLRIAEVTGKKHFHIIRDIEVIFEELEIGASKFEGSYLSQQNKKLKHYLLPEREFNLIVSGYSAKYRLQLIDELMSYRASKPKLPTTYITALEALVESEKSKQLALDKIERDKPKVEFSERIEVAINSINIGSYAKVISKEHGISVGQNKLLKWMRESDILIKSGRRKNFPKSKYMDNGYFEIKTSSVVTSFGIREVNVTLITGKGQIALVNKIVDHFNK